MGSILECKATFEGRTSAGVAQLETAELLFRGEFRLAISFQSVISVEARKGRLEVTWAGGEVAFELGPDAGKWMLKIRYPKGRLDKLGVKEGMRVAVLGLKDESFLVELQTRVTDISSSRPKKDSDIVFVGIEDKAGLDRLGKLQESLKPEGALWTIYPKGQKHLTQNDVMEAGKAAGLVDTKVVGFSDTHSSLKWMIPVARRK